MRKIKALVFAPVKPPVSVPPAMRKYVLHLRLMTVDVQLRS